MEDAHTTLLSVNEDDPTDLEQKDKKMAFFAVFDGHGGANVARYCGEHLHHKIIATHFFKAKDYKAALKHGFLTADEDLRNDPEYAKEVSGCTAVTCFILEDSIYVGNAGDSRIIISSNGEAIPLSFDHKPGNPEEIQRITAAGGYVEFGRVNGNLALSRAIGDFSFKQVSELPAERQIVTADPDVYYRKIAEIDEFVVLACDGIWDCMTNQQVVDFISVLIRQKVELGEICEQLMDRCLSPDSDVNPAGCDNMTVIIVALLRGRTIGQWQQDVADRCERLGLADHRLTLVQQRRVSVPTDVPDEGVN